jgi:acylphosphatase
MQRVHLLVHGRVQGVGFRWFVSERGRTLGVSGEVRNRPDGSVEVEAEGRREALQKLVDAVRLGPRSARVTRVEETWSEGPERHREFRITG